MPKSDFDFTVKFFHPPQRTVPCHNGLLDTRTKRTIAQDRFTVAEQRILDAERRKSASNIQSLTFEQKQIEKRLTSIYNNFNTTVTNRPLQMRGRSTSEVIFRNMRRTSSWTETLPIFRAKLSLSLHNSNQNLLSLPRIDDIQRRRLSSFSDGETPEKPFFNIDMESDEEEESLQFNSKITSLKNLTIKRKTLPKILQKQNKPLPPIVAIIPPEEDAVLFLTQ